MDRKALEELAVLAVKAFPNHVKNFGPIADSGLAEATTHVQAEVLQEARRECGSSVAALALHVTNFMDAQDEVIKSHQQAIAAANVVKDNAFAAMVYGNLKGNYNPAIVATGMMPLVSEDLRKMPKDWAKSEEGIAAIAAAHAANRAPQASAA